MPGKNFEIALLFDEIADLLELAGQNKFRVNAYHNAARSLRDITTDLAALAAQDTLTDIPNIGQSMADHIKEYLASGHVGRHEELVRQVPATLVALMRIPGLGPKKVMAIHEHLGVKTMDDLKRVLDSGRLAQLSGMGQKTADRIRHGMEFLEQAGQRVPMGAARPLAQLLREQVENLPSVQRAEIAGSMRRGVETVGDIDILCLAPADSDVVDRFTKLPLVERIVAAGPTKGSVIVRTHAGRELQADLRVVPPESFGAALLYFTGSKPHNIHLREIAIRKGWKLSEYGLFQDETMIAGKTEAQVYKKLGLPCIPPELREDAGEIESADNLPKLIELDQVRGDLHVHTVASDGHNTIEEMAQAAKDLGYEYLAISDHSKSTPIANGLSIERMWDHIEHIRKAARKIKGLMLLVSTEVDILGDGSLDYPDDLLAACDFVTASIHSGFQQPRATVTRRLIAAMENPYISSIGHLTGRLISRREPIDMDVKAIVKAAAETGTALEINAHWERLDIKDQHVRMAIEAGARIVINTDAHSLGDLDMMEYGVITARRGWAQPRDVLNTFTLAALRKWITRKRTDRHLAARAKSHIPGDQEEIPF